LTFAHTSSKLNLRLLTAFYVFVTCIVIKLCNVNQQNARLKLIRILIHWFLSSTCFEHRTFIIKSLYCTCSLIWYVFHAFMQAVWQVEGCAPDDEHEVFETCRRQEELN